MMNKKNIFKILIACFILFEYTNFANAENNFSKIQYQQAKNRTAPAIVTPSPIVSTQKTDFQTCIKTYNTTVDNLFYLTLIAISDSNYKIEELQSRNGYIIFSVGVKSFLATISKENSNRAVIKVTPTDNSYFFPSYIVQKLFQNISSLLN